MIEKQILWRTLKVPLFPCKTYWEFCSSKIGGENIHLVGSPDEGGQSHSQDPLWVVNNHSPRLDSVVQSFILGLIRGIHWCGQNKPALARNKPAPERNKPATCKELSAPPILFYNSFTIKQPLLWPSTNFLSLDTFMNELWAIIGSSCFDLGLVLYGTFPTIYGGREGGWHVR